MKHVMRISYVALTACIAASALTHTATAQSVKSASVTEAGATLAYWTPERLKSAKPKVLTTTQTFTPSAAIAAPTGPTTVVGGAPSTLRYNPSWAEMLYVPEFHPESERGPVPESVGTSHYPYTIDRLYPTSGAITSNIFVFAFYPYEIVGQLYFTEPGGNFVCSASVIRLSVIATAGHCVSNGNGSFYTNWLFIPAWHAGVAPYGRWTWSEVVVTGPWFHGGGVVPNRQDDALIVLATNSLGQKIGSVTGYLGYEYNAPLPNHLTQLGYPCNLDSCSDPIRDDSQVYSGPNNNFEWGTAAFGGASGGPEIQDFGQQPAHAPGSPPSEAFGGNVLISSTSYTYTNPAVQADGGSILAAPGQFGGSLNTFGDMINFVCGQGHC